MGRPRSADASDKILEAALELLSEVGVEGATVDAVAARAGVARATIYLRWPRRETLFTAAIRRAMGRPAITLSGDIATDIHAAAEQARAVFAAPAFLAIFPTVVRALIQPGSATERLTFDAVAPGGRLLAEEYAALGETSGFRTDVDSGVVVDLILGATIAHVLSTGRPPTKAQARQIAEIVIGGLRS